jgi:acyl dehydratase
MRPDEGDLDEEIRGHLAIAHGFLTLSLVSALMRDAIIIDGLRMTLNYGLNRVRFVSPVPSGSAFAPESRSVGWRTRGTARRRRGT